jgi:DNA-binding GntR family transcriptional regulator
VPAPATSALDRVTAELRRRIESGHYHPGGELPSSAALAAELSVSPGTILQALARLDAAGLTAGRKGRPRIVRSSRTESEATRYEQLAAWLRRSIADGELLAGSRVPAEADLAADHGVSRATVRRALQLLEAEQTLVQRAGRRYVAGAADTADLAYERVAADLRRQLTKTRRGPSRQLPGEQQLAAEYGVSRPTVRKALELLREEGLVFSQPKVGWFTASPLPRSAAPHG